MIQILDANNIQTLSIKVTEPINKKQLLKFLRTSIVNSDISFSKQSCFYYSFNKANSSYEIFVYDSNDLTNAILEPSLFLIHYPSKDNTIVYVYKNYFALFSNNQLLLLKQIQNTQNDDLKNDIQTYISQIYKIDNVEIIIISEDKLKDIKELSVDNLKQIKQFQKNMYKLYENNSYRNFLIFVAVSFFCTFLFSYLDMKSKKEMITLAKPKVQIANYQSKIIHKKPLDKILPLFKEFKKLNLKTSQISFKSNSLDLTLLSESKQNILKLMKTYNNKISMKTLRYDEKLKIYSMDVTFEL